MNGPNSNTYFIATAEEIFKNLTLWQELNSAIYVKEEERRAQAHTLALTLDFR